MENNSLQHYGIKGQKWGVRRYQNKDGSLTNLGKKRQDRDVQEHDTDWAKKNPKADPNRWVKEDLSRSKKLIDESAQMTRHLKTATDNSLKRQPKKKMDLSSMSDKELRDRINREILENQYNSMFAPQTKRRGKEFVSSALETAGSVLAVGASAAAIALAVKDLRG